MSTSGAARRGDLCSGHDDARPRPALRGSPDVEVNDRPALRAGDGFGKHGAGAHEGKVKDGSATVTFNDQPVARGGDPLDCGSTVGGASDDVFVGG